MRTLEFEIIIRGNIKAFYEIKYFLTGLLPYISVVSLQVNILDNWPSN